MKKIYFVKGCKRGSLPVESVDNKILVPTMPLENVIDRLEWMVTYASENKQRIETLDFVAMCNSVSILRDLLDLKIHQLDQ
ncbi:hypothetical protein [uncultured Desulfovibrio sp.]|jgi:hypothetical protein|uniref:hypothetical protein n=1 Tax=uncultured Desulfovibrio sp. TaxID=167968 RepID=UPI00258F804D|nr:hypothetical protein [uncultured Desulfovibrio sp.]